MARRSIVLSLALPLGLSTLAAACHAGTAEVNYVKAEEFTDAGRNAFDRERTLQSFTAYFKELAGKLPDGQVLKLDVTDIDLAGEVNPMRLDQIRVLRGRADWPRMSLHYALQEGSKTLRSGDAKLADINYLYGPHASSNTNADLPYEKHMVQAWFDATFLAH